MPFIIVEAGCGLDVARKEELRECLIGVFERHNTSRDVTGIAISADGKGERRELRILTAMQPRLPDTVVALEQGYAEAVRSLGYELSSNRFVQVLPEDWPHPKWAT